VAALFGAALAGAVAVPMSTFAPEPELAHMARLAEVVMVLTQTHLLDRAFAHDLSGLRDQLPALREVVAVGDGWDAFLAAGDSVDPADLATRADEVTPDDDGLIIF